MISPALRREFQVACGAVLTECNDPYAKSYAAAGLTLVTCGRDDALPAQAMYILSNAQYWKGANAARIKSVLRLVASEL